MAIPQAEHQFNGQATGNSAKRRGGRNRRRRAGVQRNQSGNLSDAGSTASSSSQSLLDWSSSSEGSSVGSGTPQRPRPQQQKQHPQPSGVKKSSSASRHQKESDDVSPEERAKYLALDCEMVGVGVDGFASALARVTLVDWNGQVVMDQYIRPECPVTDYRTFVSGITAECLEGEEAVSLECCRRAVLELLEGKVLVGHGLKNDLRALGIQHPWQMTRDTAKYEPFMKVRFDDGILWPRKLKDLALERLARNIQEYGRPHSSVEDAVAAMDLYKSVRCPWEKVMDYKINRTKEIEQQKEKV